MANAVGGLYRGDSWAFPAMGGPLLRTTSSGNYSSAVDLLSMERRLKAEGQFGEQSGEGLGKTGMDLHQSHSMPLPDGVSVTVDTVRAFPVSKKAASPAPVFSLAADARDGMPPPQPAAESRELFVAVLGEADFGHSGASPRHMVQLQGVGNLFGEVEHSARAPEAAEAPAAFLPDTPATDLFMNAVPFGHFFPEAAQTPRQSVPTPPLRGGPFHVQHSPGSPNNARGHGLHAAHSMPVMLVPSPHAAHRHEPALGQLHQRTASMPLPFGADQYAYAPVCTSLDMDSVTEHSLGPRQAGVRKAGARAAGRRRAGLAPGGDGEASGVTPREPSGSGSDSESEGSGECASGARKRKPKRRGGNKKGRRMTCRNCGTHQTPQWRCGPEGPRSLCNACGVRYKKGLPLVGWPGTLGIIRGQRPVPEDESSPSSSS
ncbi:hypothetical protein WJX81_007763 [Elliptochloris bilobata]|uniref:GATA-type domain-containing protein n=1 Tax=Elliptochloris bilobata TaxID=381761 RepID=A0AAW1RCZ6_9CHLO